MEFREAPIGARAAPLIERAEADAEVALTAEWLELAAARPALFPVRADKNVTRYAKELTRFVERNGDHPKHATAESWLASWRKAQQAK